MPSANWLLYASDSMILFLLTCYMYLILLLLTLTVSTHTLTGPPSKRICTTDAAAAGPTASLMDNQYSSLSLHFTLYFTLHFTFLYLFTISRRMGMSHQALCLVTNAYHITITPHDPLSVTLHAHLLLIPLAYLRTSLTSLVSPACILSARSCCKTPCFVVVRHYTILLLWGALDDDTQELCFAPPPSL